MKKFYIVYLWMKILVFYFERQFGRKLSPTLIPWMLFVLFIYFLPELNSEELFGLLTTCAHPHINTHASFSHTERITPSTVHYKMLAVLQGIKYLTEQ